MRFSTEHYNLTFTKNRNVLTGLTASGKTNFINDLKDNYSVNVIFNTTAYLSALDVEEDIIILDDCNLAGLTKSDKKKFYKSISDNRDKLIFSLGRNINLPQSDAWELVKVKDKIINLPYLNRPKQFKGVIPDTLILVTEDTCSGYNLWNNLEIDNKIIYPEVVNRNGKLKCGGIRCLTQFIREHQDIQYGIILDYVYDNISILYEIKQLIDDKTITNYSIIYTRTAEELILVDDYLRDNYSLTKEDYSVIKNIILDNDTLSDINLTGTYENRVTQFLKNRIGYSKSKSINIKLSKETNPFLRELQFNKNFSKFESSTTNHFG